MKDTWFQKARMDWITETLSIFGFINREHLMKKFSISRPQASADLRLYQEKFPSAMTYDKSLKRYLATDRDTHR
jgi:hypothetical protein